MGKALSDLLARRRPNRADARRNFDALLAAAAEAFTELGAEVPLEEIARRAGVGIATLYRNFPTREDLMECVYVTSVEELCRHAERLAEDDPWPALVAWLRRFVVYLGTKHVLRAVLSRESEVFQPCRDALYGVAGPLLERAQRAHAARTDVDIDDILRLVFGVTGGIYRDGEQRERVIRIVVDGLRAPAPDSRV
ncbi:MAG TPA: TetR/AcrR family transcriptional regulator [Amycolatopsis sp.]|nr:TetR/AcrR family transcriptional regulator [Amycolatopsis sp.]